MARIQKIFVEHELKMDEAMFSKRSCFNRKLEGSATKIFNSTEEEIPEKEKLCEKKLVKMKTVRNLVLQI